MAMTHQRNGVNPDLKTERSKAVFDVEEVTNVLDGGKEKTKRRKEFEQLLFQDPDFRMRDVIYLSLQDLYGFAIKKTVKLLKLKRELGWTDDEYDMANKLTGGHNPCSLHHAMFIPTLERLATDEQKEKWLTPARNYRILGTYAQTELGHGSNLAGLETTATFDKATDEFVLTSPKLSSIKWWPGSMANSSTHALVLAQLVIDGKNLGFNAFMVQLRSMDDHSHMPGINCGVNGPRMGTNSVDNGYLMLNNVRVPRGNMLMKYQQVSRDGTYTSRGPDKANYATLVYLRAMICVWLYGSLSNAVTTAVRYSAVRRQSTLKPGSQEMQVLDYQTQQYKLLPAMATAYAFVFVHKAFKKRYLAMMDEIQQGIFTNLPEMHAMSSGIKALGTELVMNQIETCRRACGGHGYLRSAGIVELFNDIVPLCTADGENTVLYLQEARYLVKQMELALSGQTLAGFTEYLSRLRQGYICPLQRKEDCRDIFLLCDLYKKRAYSLILEATQSLRADSDAGYSQDVALNRNLQPLVNAAIAHSYVVTVTGFVEGLTSESLSPPAKKVLTDVCCLFITHYINKLSGEFLEAEALDVMQLKWLQDQELELFAEIRPDSVALVDAFDIHDETLCSAIGCYDGWAYERLYESTLRDPINKTEVDPSYYKHLKQLMTEGVTAKL